MEMDDLTEDMELDEEGEEILSAHQSKNALMFALHAHLKQFELHLDSITNKYKTLSLFWLLATYVAIGFLFSVESKNLQINPLLTVGATCLFGIIGVSTLWYIDIHTIHKFIGAFFIEGINMERKYKFLLEMGNLSLSLKSVGSRIHGHENFYIFANLLLLVSAGVSLVLLIKSSALQIGISFLVIVLAFSLLVTMRMIGQRLQFAIESLLEKKHSR